MQEPRNISLANYSFIGTTKSNLEEILSIDYSTVCGLKMLFMGSSTGMLLVDGDSKALENVLVKLIH
ncbi:MAG: hypothetical protein U0V03_11905 [Bacteroidia bacterium]